MKNDNQYHQYISALEEIIKNEPADSIRSFVAKQALEHSSPDSFGKNEDPNEGESPVLTVQIEALKTKLLEDMLDYIKGAGSVHYSVADVDECQNLFERFIGKFKGPKTDQVFALSQVKELVIALNKLNKRCGECLIETGQREDNCELIGLVLSEAGFNFTGDVTEEWREW